MVDLRKDLDVISPGLRYDPPAVPSLVFRTQKRAMQTG
jgi:hypothetical protein